MQIKELCYKDCELLHNEIIGFLRRSIETSFIDNEILDDFYELKFNELKTYLKENKAKVFIAVVKEKVCGLIWCHFIDRFDRKRIHIAYFAVLSNVEGQGVGSKLYSAVEEYARAQGCSEIDLMVSVSNENAVNFYESKGFSNERLLMKKKF